MGACAMAPVVLVNNKRMCDYMTNEKLDALVDELSRRG
jgi:NADH-quinone oxidoreductase subunit E